MNILREKLVDGVCFSHISTDKYKSARLSVNFICPMDKEYVTERSLLMSMLRQDTAEFEDYSELNMTLSDLYGASIYSDTAKIGDIQVLTIGSGFLNDSALPDGETVTIKIAETLKGIIFNSVCRERGFSKELLGIEKENLREAMLSEINDKKRYALKRALEIYFDNEAYSVPSDGIIEKLDLITGEDLCVCYNELLKTAAVEIVYDGSGYTEEIKTMFKDAFSKVFERKPFYPENKPMKAKEPLVIIEKMDVNQAKEVMLFACPKVDPAVLKVMSALYGGTPFSFLFKEVREKRSLCYYCSASYVRSKNMMMVESGVDTAKADEAEKAVVDELEKLSAGSFTDEELENTKQYLVGLYKSVEDTPSSYLDRYLSDLVLSSAALSEEAEKISCVTREDIILAAKGTVLCEIYRLTSEGEND